MHPQSIVVSAHINELLAESAAERLARSARPTSPREHRFASAVRSVWSTLSGPVSRPMSLPELSDYPFRG